ncbi:MAG: ABC transporter permease [Planctomycetota bacterium]
MQYGRWLNRVSPVGFVMAGDTKLTAKQRDAVSLELSDQPFVRRDADLQPAVRLVETIAAYRGDDPIEVARILKHELATPSVEGTLRLAALMDVAEEDFTAGTDALATALGRLMNPKARALADRRGATVFGRPVSVPVKPQPGWSQADPRTFDFMGFSFSFRVLQREPSLADAQSRVLSELGIEVGGRDRIDFASPKIKAPDLGDSQRGREVSDLILEALPVTLLINLTAIPIIYTLSIFMGVYAAKYRGTVVDWGVGAATVGLWSMPVMWVGMMLIAWFASAEYPSLQWFPSNGLHDLQADRMAFLPSWNDEGFQRGYMLDTMWHLALPVLCTVYGGFAVMSKVMRGAVLEAESADYIRTARAKGLSERVILWRHSFRNSLLPLITMISGILPAMFAGSVIIEVIFGLNGMGKLGFDAAFQKDPDVLMGVVLIASLLKLSAELIRDICYAIADPRVSYD